MRPLVSPRARVIAVICYLGLPLPYGALGMGRWDGLVAYAAFPFIALRLARAAAVEPYNVAAVDTLAQQAGWADRPPRRHHRRRRRIRTSSCPARPAPRGGVGARLGACRRTRCAAGGSSSWRPKRWVWRSCSPFLGSSAPLWPGRPRWGSSACPSAERPHRVGATSCALPSVPPPSRRWPGSSSWRRRCRYSWVGARGWCGPPACGSPRSGPGAWPWPPTGATWVRSPPRRPSCSLRRHWPSPRASAWASPRSRTT